MASLLKAACCAALARCSLASLLKCSRDVSNVERSQCFEQKPFSIGKVRPQPWLPHITGRGRRRWGGKVWEHNIKMSLFYYSTYVLIVKRKFKGVGF